MCGKQWDKARIPIILLKTERGSVSKAEKEVQIYHQ
jgi:hypothetical protein